jgi:hypothetical protein
MRANRMFELSVFTLLVLSSIAIPSSATDFDPLIAAPSGAEVDANNKASLMRAIGQADLSPEAKNIQVIGKNGSTILRGVVKDDRERQTIGSLAQQAGCSNIKNELTVASAARKKIPSKALIINKPR